MSKSPFEIRLEIFRQAYHIVCENSEKDSSAEEVVEASFELAARIKAFVDKS
jgi:hypothetical protein